MSISSDFLYHPSVLIYCPCVRCCVVFVHFEERDSSSVIFGVLNLYVAYNFLDFSCKPELLDTINWTSRNET